MSNEAPVKPTDEAKPVDPNQTEEEQSTAAPEGQTESNLNKPEPGDDECPRCAVENIKLIPLPLEMQLGLMNASLKDAQSEGVCSECFKIYKIGMHDKDFLLKKNAELTGKSPRLWKSRMEAIKKGRAAQVNGDFVEAGHQFEEYIRILEICFDLPPGCLNPQVFREQARFDEMKTLTLVLWELIKIYDGKEEAKCEKACQNLLTFVECTTLKTSLIEKVATYQPRALNKKLLKKLHAQLRGETSFFGWLKGG